MAQTAPAPVRVAATTQPMTQPQAPHPSQPQYQPQAPRPFQPRPQYQPQAPHHAIDWTRVVGAVATDSGLLVTERDSSGHETSYTVPYSEICP